MPKKPVDSRKVKNAPTGSKQKHTPQNKKTEPPQASSSSVGINDAHIAKVKRTKKKRLRRVLSLSIVTYLGYNFFYACGSPFDETSEKPAICGGIDPIKLDLYKVYESEFYKANIDPHVDPIVVKVSGLYNEYGVPVQTQLVALYDQHGKPLLNQGCSQAARLYAQHLEPTLSPLIEKSKIQANQAKIQLQPYLQEASKKAELAQDFAKQQWDNLPPPVKQAKDQAVETVLELYHRAENTQLAPILLDLYWKIIDFYQYQFLPFIQNHPTTAQVNKFYEENIKSYVDHNVKPLLLVVKDRTHVNQLLNHALTLLPQREISASRKSTVASSIVETKTPVSAAKVISEIPVTTTTTATATSTATEKAKTVVSKASSKKVAEPASSAIPVKEKAASTVSQQEASSTTTASASTSTTFTATESVKTQDSTIAKDASQNDDDIMEPVSVRPTATPEYVDLDVEPPRADKKEAVYCPTCNAQDEQVIVAPTDKHIVPVRDEKEVFEIHTEKEVFEIHTDKEVFEVNKEPVAVPPQSPAKDTLDKHADQVVIQAPIKQQEPKSAVEEPVLPVEKEQQQEEEEQVFSTQVEHDVNDNDDAFKLDQDGLPEPATPLKEVVEDEEPVVKVVVDKQQVEIPVPVVAGDSKEEKEEENIIIVPNDESVFAAAVEVDNEEQIVIQAPPVVAKEQAQPIIEKEAIHVEPIAKEPIVVDEPIAKEPIVPNDESKFEAVPEQQQEAAQEEPVRYYRVEEALSQCSS